MEGTLSRRDLNASAIRFILVDGFRIAAAILSGSVLLAACGGTAKQASIRRPVAMRLASQSDAVAAALRSGDECLAATRARTLRAHVVAAIGAGAIPTSLAADARGASARLVSKVSCPRAVPPPVSAAPSCEAEHGRGKQGKGKDVGDQRKGCE